MKKVLITGADGFLGKNLALALRRCGNYQILGFGRSQTIEELDAGVAVADVVFHFAGINRPKDPQEFKTGNAGFTETLCDMLGKHRSKAAVLMSSSTQATLDNPYGRSKLAAENILIESSKKYGFPVAIYRFPNLFGKWSQPNYNSVVSTFCYNAANGIPLQINDPARKITFAYVGDVVEECLRWLETGSPSAQAQEYHTVEPTYEKTLAELADLVEQFGAVRNSGVLPDLADPFIRKLYSTFLSYYDTDSLAYSVDMKRDERGWLFEFLKSPHFGQIFISKTRPGVTRGNHGHNTKVEKFCVIQGKGTIRFRHLITHKISEYHVSDSEIKIVDIPTAYTHSIENTGDTEMLTLFWANEVFNPTQPDTYFDPVLS